MNRLNIEYFSDLFHRTKILTSSLCLVFAWHSAAAPPLYWLSLHGHVDQLRSRNEPGNGQQSPHIELNQRTLKVLNFHCTSLPNRGNSKVPEKSNLSLSSLPGPKEPRAPGEKNLALSCMEAPKLRSREELCLLAGYAYRRTAKGSTKQGQGRY